jgi:RNA polymerase sigma-70 factor (ECF subfamily)
VSATPETGALLEHLFRRQAGRITAHLTRLLGPARIDLAEEMVQEAMLRAIETWPHQGLPENPAAWLFRVAHNAAIDAVRRTQMIGYRTDAIIAELTRSTTIDPQDRDFEEQLCDDELHMIFMCCHPEIPRDASVALSLKIAGGFSTREIARAFLADDQTIAQRLVRAKRHIRDRRLTLEMPEAHQLPERLGAVMEVIYFIFNEGYAANEGEDLIRHDLCFEALRLGRLIVSSSIAEPRTHALMAVMALQGARLPARTNEAGDLILLEDQDRTRWDHELIACGFHHFELAIAGSDVSEYHVQAAIAATHARARSVESIEWPLILELYDQLFAMNPSPVVELNRAVAIAKVRGPAEAVAAIEPLAGDKTMRDYYLFLAVRGHLLMELGRPAVAAGCFRAALECHCSEPERRFLRRRLEECGAGEAKLG